MSSTRCNIESPNHFPNFGYEFQHAKIFISACLPHLLARIQARHLPLFLAPYFSVQICGHIPHTIITRGRSYSQNICEALRRALFSPLDRILCDFPTIPRFLQIGIANEIRWIDFLARDEKALSSRAKQLAGKNPANKLLYEAGGLLQKVAVKILRHNGSNAWSPESRLGCGTYSHSLLSNSVLDMFKRAIAQKGINHGQPCAETESRQVPLVQLTKNVGLLKSHGFCPGYLKGGVQCIET